jgi:hypothetical protein
MGKETDSVTGEAGFASAGDGAGDWAGLGVGLGVAEGIGDPEEGTGKVDAEVPGAVVPEVPGIVGLGGNNRFQVAGPAIPSTFKPAAF